DFFGLGGDSLRSTELLIRIEKRFGAKLSLDMLLQASTVEQQAATLREHALAQDLDNSGQRPAPTAPVASSEVHTTKASSVTTRDQTRSPRHKPVWRGAFNRILHLLCRVLPGATNLRPFLHRLRGVRIEGRVSIGDDVTLRTNIRKQWKSMMEP